MFDARKKLKVNQMAYVRKIERQEKANCSLITIRVRISEVSSLWAFLLLFFHFLPLVPSCRNEASTSAVKTPKHIETSAQEHS